MTIVAVIVAVIVAFSTRRSRPALVAGLTLWSLAVLFLTVVVRLLDDAASDPEHALTTGFWVFQSLTLVATIVGSVGVARLRGERAARVS